MDQPMKLAVGADANRRDGSTLIIDTTYGMSVGVVGNEPLYEADSRSHVEKLEPLVNAALRQAGLSLADVSAIVSLIGPGPFTGLRAGIVFAKAAAFATGAQLIGQNVLEPQAWWNPERTGNKGPQVVLAINNARRRQLYYQLFVVGPSDFIASIDAGAVQPGDAVCVAAVSEMGIDSAQTIAQKAAHIVSEAFDGRLRGLPISVVGHGAGLASDLWMSAFADACGAVDVCDASVVHAAGARGLEIVAHVARRHADLGDDVDAIPLYLRRPDAQLPPPLKHVTEGARAADVASADSRVARGTIAHDDTADAYRAEAPVGSHEVVNEVADALIWTRWAKETSAADTGAAGSKKADDASSRESGDVPADMAGDAPDGESDEGRS